MYSGYSRYEDAIGYSRPEEDIEWSQVYAYNTADTAHPRVLLIGDSICNGYQGALRSLLAGKVNVSYWISSKCITSKGYAHELVDVLDARKYDMITFNNGLHSLNTPLAPWEMTYRMALRFIRAKRYGVPLCVVNSTPLTDPDLTAKVAALNEIAEQIAADLDLPVIDLFHPMDALDRATYWSDTYHFKDAAIQQQAQIMAEKILSTLGIDGDK